ASSSRKLDPVTGWGSVRSTVVVAFCWGTSVMAGSATVPAGSPSTLSATSVGTEWSVSATTVSGSVSTGTGAGRLTPAHGFSGSLGEGVRAVVGSPSKAADAVWESPASNELARAHVTDPSWGRPSVSSDRPGVPRAPGRARPRNAGSGAPG